MTCDVVSTFDPALCAGPVRGVRNPARLRAVAKAEIAGHLGDPDLDAVVSTLRLACQVPIAVINIVTTNLQTYPAELGVGAPCTAVPDHLSFCAEVVDSGFSLAVADAQTHPVYSQNPMVLDGVIGAYAGVPLVDDGFILGSVSIFDGHSREFSSDVLEILRNQAQLAASVLALRRSARTDVLTGLPNRGMYMDRLSQTIKGLGRRGGFAGVLYLDVDNFKSINDHYGHDVGDQVLVELGSRISRVIRPTDTVARFGGDEFLAICEDLETQHGAELMAERLTAAINEIWHIDSQAIYVAVSIGTAVTASASTQPDDLIRAADADMYEVKRRTASSLIPATRQAPHAEHLPLTEHA